MMGLGGQVLEASKSKRPRKMGLGIASHDKERSGETLDTL